MVCYARPAGRMAAVVLVVLLVFGRHVGHFFDAAALTVAITVAAGGCVSCQLRCQHAMTEQPRRLVVSTLERGPVAARDGTAVPRWPDRPAYRSAAAGRPGGHVARRERAGSAV